MVEKSAIFSCLLKDAIVILILVVAVIIGVLYIRKHFKGKSGCCGSGSNYISKKKLKKVISKKKFVVEGMTCENCEARVLRYVNDIEGAVGKINLKKKELIVSMEREIATLQK